MSTPSPQRLPGKVITKFKPPHELLARDDVALPQLYDWNAQHNAEYPLFVFHDGERLVHITYHAANQAIDRSASLILQKHGPSSAHGSKQPVIGLFADSDAVSYVCTAIGVMRAGYVAFFISIKNGPAAIADMLRRTNATALLVSPDATTSRIAQEAVGLMSGTDLTILEMPEYEYLFASDSAASDRANGRDGLLRTFDVNSTAMIQHSSGSTGHPKPIYWTHRRLVSLGTEPLQCTVDISRSIISCHGTPMYHGLGSDMFSTAPVLGVVLATFKPQSPPTVPSPDAVWNGMVSTRSDYTWGVPSFIEQWSREPKKIAVMKQMRGIMFGGAPLRKDVGDALASQGVSIYNAYGSTEVGLMTLLVREDPGLDWEYFRLSPRHACAFVPQGDGKFEIVVPSRPENPLPVTNAKLDGRDAYATSDIVVRHPTDETLWKIFGRTDEQIILSNGENTNPIPLEAIINDDPHVKASLIFGHGRFQNGVLIEPAREHVIDPNSIEDLERFRNMIWPSVQRANDYAPQHSKIFKEMIVIASPSKPFQHNVKGLLRRKFIISDYESEIDALYHAVENSATSDVEPPTSWDNRSTLVFVREIVQNTLGWSIADDADIFRSGGDSLQATRIRNIIRRSLRSTGHHEEASGLPPDVVFDSPTILALSKAVLAIASGDQPEAPNIPRTPDDLWTYVEKYAADLPARPEGLSDHSRPVKDIVLITGTTGGFGCDVLEHLLRDDQVERVYALNRKDSDVVTRQRKQFCARGLDGKLLDSPKLQLVEGTLHEDGFGIRADLLDEIRRSVTHVMHNAWKVNFNMSLPSFEADLQGTRNLVKLALESPYKTPSRVIFVSSVGVFSNFEGAPPALEAPLDDPASAFGTGYSEAKWIAERVLQRVTHTTALHTVTVRLGQVCGDRVGHWNEREWFPSVVKSARFQGCLPDAKGSVLWVPSYDAAKAFAEMRHSHEPVLHLVHPRPIPWSDIIAPIASQLNVPLVPFAEWLTKLQKSAEADTGLSVELMEKNPALRLLAFFTNVVLSPEREPMGGVYLSTKRSTAASPTLARLTALNEGWVKRWLDEWKKSGFL